MKRILIISNGGIAKTKDGKLWGNGTTGDFLVNLLNEGYRITYISHLGDKVKNKFLYNFDLTRYQIKGIILHGRRPKSYFSLVNLFLLLLLHKHIYIFYPGGPSKNTAKFCQFLGKKYGVYIRGNGSYVFDRDRIKGNYYEYENSNILAKAFFLIAVSDKLKDNLRQYNKTAKIDIIKPMLNWDLEDISDKKRSFYEKTEWKLLFIGSIIELKGIDDLLSAVKIILKSRINFQLQIVGDGKLLPCYIQKQKNGEIPSNVNFIGSLTSKEELINTYKDADLFVFPSRNEGFPRVLYEAMINKLPIFTTMVGGIPGLMQNNYNCIELPVNDPEGQANAILRNINNPRRLEKIVNNGVITVTEVLTNRKPHHEVLINCINSKY